LLASYLHDLSPFIFQVGGWGPRWYGVSYVLSFLPATCSTGGSRMRLPKCGKVADFVARRIFGVMLGGRLSWIIHMDGDVAGIGRRPESLGRGMSVTAEFLAWWRLRIGLRGAIAFRGPGSATISCRRAGWLVHRRCANCQWRLYPARRSSEGEHQWAVVSRQNLAGAAQAGRHPAR
jgi:hypothetical protein